MSTSTVLRHECPVIEVEVPASLQQMSEDAVSEYAWAAMIKSTGDDALNAREQAAIEIVEAIGEALLSKDDYRSPVYVTHPRDLNGFDLSDWVAYTFAHYHGAKAYRTFAGVGTHGYAAY